VRHDLLGDESPHAVTHEFHERLRADAFGQVVQIAEHSWIHDQVVKWLCQALPALLLQSP
jgi:hypothetical protein